MSDNLMHLAPAFAPPTSTMARSLVPAQIGIFLLRKGQLQESHEVGHLQLLGEVAGGDMASHLVLLDLQCRGN
jgi:hypothetical protein